MNSRIARLLAIGLLPVAIFILIFLAKTTIARLPMNMRMELASPTVGGPTGDGLLLEIGDYFLLESNDFIELE